MTTVSSTSREFAAVRFYLDAKREVLAGPYAWEIVWQTEQGRRGTFTEPDLLRESAWVILCSGMREQIVRRAFPRISEVFGDWLSAQEIARDARRCVRRGMAVFANGRKLRAIAKIATDVASSGFETIKGEIEAAPISRLQALPYIGPVTAYHLAKNIGFPVCKPDRHLVRLADALGFDASRSLCECVSMFTADPVAVVDVVFWRYFASRSLKDRQRQLRVWN